MNLKEVSWSSLQYTHIMQLGGNYQSIHLHILNCSIPPLTFGNDIQTDEKDDEFGYEDVYESTDENCNTVNIFKTDLSHIKEEDSLAKKVTVKVQRTNKSNDESKEEFKEECKEESKYQSTREESKYEDSYDDRGRYEEKEGSEDSKSSFDKPVKRRGSFGAIILSPIKNIVSVTSNRKPAPTSDKTSSKTKDILVKKKRRKSTETSNELDLDAIYQRENVSNDNQRVFDDDDLQETHNDRKSSTEMPYTGMSANEFFSKVRHNHYDIVRANVESFDLTLRDEKGNTALIVACQNNHKKIAALLVDHGCDLNAVNRKGLTALDTADLFKFTNLAQYLVLQGAENATAESMTNYSEPKYMATADLKSFR